MSAKRCKKDKNRDIYLTKLNKIKMLVKNYANNPILTVIVPSKKIKLVLF
jgi:hypothetical protein